MTMDRIPYKTLDFFPYKTLETYTEIKRFSTHAERLRSLVGNSFFCVEITIMRGEIIRHMVINEKVSRNNRLEEVVFLVREDKWVLRTE